MVARKRTDLRGKHCLITGAASGIGRSTAIVAARRGAVLHLTDLNEAPLRTVAGELEAGGAQVASVHAADLADFDAVVALADAIHAERDALDVVMNIAGVSTWGAVETLEHRHWKRTIDVDLMGPIHVIERFVAPMVRAGRGGHLVNVSSAAGLFGLPWHAPYSAAKFGLRGVSEVLRFDLARHGIGVSLVCPGAVKTPLVGTVDIVGVDRDAPAMRKLTARFEHRAVSPERVADLIVDAVERNRYLVLTSRDITLGHLAQRYVPFAYERAMQVANDTFVRAVRRAG